MTGNLQLKQMELIFAHGWMGAWVDGLVGEWIDRNMYV